MSLAAGTRLGPYEVTAPLGEGGMGEVYRARDTRLQRDVAIKVLPDSFAGDPDRLARFRREAQLLASLNHPNIAAIYGFEETDRANALVLELVQGPTLAERIAQGPVPSHEALSIAKQIAEALEAAHDSGVIHRDLKPANIKIRPDGMVKVLDFGLAKALDSSPPDSLSATLSPTLSMQATQAGLILGTAAYMSPEQAAGRVADKRSDMWAFGVVLMEMVTGSQVFDGESVPHVLASVLKSDPDWTRLPAGTPNQIRRLLHRCLEKDRKRRLDSATAARLEIEDAASAPEVEPIAHTGPSRRRVALIAGGAGLAAGLVAALVTWAVSRPITQPPRQPSRFIVSLATHPVGSNQFDRGITIAPDGRRFAYVSAANSTSGTGARLMMREFDRLTPTEMRVTSARSPFFSFDSQWLGFFEATELKKMPVANGPPILLCAFTGAPRGASWGDDGMIVFATADPTTGLWQVPQGGGKPIALTTPNVSNGEGDHWFPSVLPGGRGVLFTIEIPGQADRAEIAVYDARTKQTRTLTRGTEPQYIETGHLVYASDATVWAVRFDLNTLTIAGDPAPLIEQVQTGITGAANYAVSRSGTLVYVPNGPDPQRSLVWIDRNGHEDSIKAPPRAYVIARLSPDGNRVVFSARDQDNDIWVLDLAHDAMPRRLTYGPSVDMNPMWISNSEIVFTSNRAGRLALYKQAADGSGTAEPITASGSGKFATSMVPDGSAIVGHQDGPSVYDVVLFPLPHSRSSTSPSSSAADAMPPIQELVKTRHFEFNADVSPNGRYLAYQTNESGPYQLIVRPFPHVEAGTWTISTGAGSSPVWARNGKELFYRDESDSIVAVPVDTTGPLFSWGAPRKLFPFQEAGIGPERAYDVSPDGQRFLVIKDSSNARGADVVVVLDWLEELKDKVPAAGAR